MKIYVSDKERYYNFKNTITNNRAYLEMSSDRIIEVESLDQHDAEVRKPLEEEIKEAYDATDNLELQLREQYQLVDKLYRKNEKLEKANKKLKKILKQHKTYVEEMDCESVKDLADCLEKCQFEFFKALKENAELKKIKGGN